MVLGVASGLRGVLAGAGTLAALTAREALEEGLCWLLVLWAEGEPVGGG